MGRQKQEKTLKNAYMLAGMRLGMLLRLIFRNGITFRLRYIARTLFLLQAAFWSSVVAWADRCLNKKLPQKPPAPEDPIFIISHWRTGSTYLHQLLNCDPELTAPTLFQCSFPDSFRTSRRFVAPV